MSLVNLKTPWGDVVCPAWEDIIELSIRWLPERHMLFKGETYRYETASVSVNQAWHGAFYGQTEFTANVTLRHQLRVYDMEVVDFVLFFENRRAECINFMSLSRPMLSLGSGLFTYEFTGMHDSNVVWTWR